MRALVIEHDLMSQCVLARLLNERGLEVSSYENAEQAILAYQKDFYPLVFVDADLPGMNGFEFCRWIRSQPEGERIFILLAIAADQPGDLPQVTAVGANDFLCKPYDVGHLKVRLAVLMRQIEAFFREKETQAQLQRHQTENARLRQELQSEIGRGRDMEAQLAGTRETLSGQIEVLTGELKQANEARQREAGDRRRVEDDLASVREELIQTRGAFERQLEEQKVELSSATDELVSATTFRLRIEDDLQEAREKLRNETERLAQELAGVQGKLDQERARYAELSDLHQRTCQELEQRLEEQVDARRQAEERREEDQRQQQRAALAFARAEADWEQRRQELQRQLEQTLEAHSAQDAERRRLREDLEASEALCQQLDVDLGRAREDFVARLQAHTGELVRLTEALEEFSRGRRQLEEELVQAREELAAKSRDYAQAVMKAGEELEAVMTRREESRQTWETDRREFQLQLAAREARIAELLDLSVAGLGEGGVPGGDAADEIRKLQEVLRQKEAELARLGANLEAETVRRQESDAALQKARLQIEERMRLFKAALDGAPVDAVEVTAA